MVYVIGFALCFVTFLLTFDCLEVGSDLVVITVAFSWFVYFSFGF